MKTAIDELIEYLEDMQNDDFDSKTQYILETCLKSKEKEKQQIIDAFTNSRTSDGCGWNKEDAKQSAEGYYNEIYNQ